MTQVPRPATASSTQTPPAATTTPPRITQAPRGIAESASTISSAAESPSCFSQIGSMISSLVSSIFSWISSLWNCGTGETSQTTPTGTSTTTPVRTPAEILSAHAHSFFNEINSLDIPQHAPHKIALLIKVDGQRIALFTRDLPPANTTTNPLREFCSEGMGRLRSILSQNTSLTPQSNVELSMAVIRRHSDPESSYRGTPASYRLLAATLIPRDNISYNLTDGHSGSVPVFTAAENCIDGMFADHTPDEDHLRKALMYFIANHANARSGWTYRA